MVISGYKNLNLFETWTFNPASDQMFNDQFSVDLVRDDYLFFVRSVRKIGPVCHFIGKMRTAARAGEGLKRRGQGDIMGDNPMYYSGNLIGQLKTSRGLPTGRIENE